MGKFCGRVVVGDGNTKEGKGIYQPPLFDKTKMNTSIGQIQEHFTQVGNYAVAQGGYTYGTAIADEHKSPEPVFSLRMKFVHGCGHQGTEKNVHGVKGIEDFKGNLVRDAERCIQHHNEDTCQSSENGKR